LSQREVAIFQDLLEKILASVGPKAVLVGGQAHAVWLTSYQVAIPPIDGPDGTKMLGVVTDDADFPGDRSDVTRIEQNLRGSAEFAPRVGLSALVGSVRLQVSNQEFVNVDVIHRVVGLRKEDVRKHAFAMVIGDAQARIMHPLDVLRSCIENLG
jgi:hypothetical protein